MKHRDVIDAEYQVVEPRYPWRIRFWPSVLFWAAVIATAGAASENIPTTEFGYVPAYVLGAALISPAVRFICWLFASSSPVDEQAALLERSRRLGRAGSR